MALIRKIAIEPKLDFMSRRFLFFVFSVILVSGSIGLFLVQGLNFGVDFRGGTLLEVRVNEGTTISDLRSRVSGLPLGEITLQEFGNPQDILINIARQPGEEAEQLVAIEQVRAAIDDRVQDYRRQEFVGPKVGAELKRAGALATILALAGIGLYIWFRFEWHFSVAAMVALAHDVIATIGFFSLTQIEFNLATLAAVLMIAGYSINDTVVIFDRVREMLRRYKKLPLDDLLNQAINRTLSRTLLTSVTTLLALLSLLFFGGEVIRGFSMGLVWGVLIGTYSSVGLAVPILSKMKIRRAGGGEADEKDGESSVPETAT
jgi:preprotein translocase SecF subunit